MKAQKSKMVSKLKAGETVLTAKLNLTGQRLADLIAMSGFECLWLDMEHTPNTLTDIESQIFAASANGVEVIVRTPRGGYSEYIRPLEMGASGIMIPHLKSLDDAKELVRQTRFFPLGRRALDGGNADNAYGTYPSSDYTENANRNTLLIVQIEDPEPMDELDKIAELEGIDMIFFGPGDYSHALGIPGELFESRVQEARIRVAETAIRHGKLAGTVGGPDTLPLLLDMGYTFINVASDVYTLRSGMSESYREAMKAVESRKKHLQSA